MRRARARCGAAEVAGGGKRGEGRGRGQGGEERGNKASGDRTSGGKASTGSRAGENERRTPVRRARRLRGRQKWACASAERGRAPPAPSSSRRPCSRVSRAGARAPGRDVLQSSISPPSRRMAIGRRPEPPRRRAAFGRREPRPWSSAPSAMVRGRRTRCTRSRGAPVQFERGPARAAVRAGRRGGGTAIAASLGNAGERASRRVCDGLRRVATSHRDAARCKARAATGAQTGAARRGLRRTTGSRRPEAQSRSPERVSTFDTCRTAPTPRAAPGAPQIQPEGRRPLLRGRARAPQATRARSSRQRPVHAPGTRQTQPHAARRPTKGDEAIRQASDPQSGLRAAAPARRVAPRGAARRRARRRPFRARPPGRGAPGRREPRPRLDGPGPFAARWRAHLLPSPQLVRGGARGGTRTAKRRENVTARGKRYSVVGLQRETWGKGCGRCAAEGRGQARPSAASKLLEERNWAEAGAQATEVQRPGRA